MFLPEPKLEKDILKTAVYFDLFDYPLTDIEIWQFLPVKCSYSQIRKTLRSNKNLLEQANGFYYLPGRKNCLRIKQQRYCFENNKIKKAVRISRLLSKLPWIKLICLANIIGSHNLKQGGDLDFFIITGKNRIWISRLFAVGLIKALNQRPKKEKIANTICLSFWSSDENSDLSCLLQKQSNEQPDRYFNFWLAGLFPIYDKGKTFSKFLISNSWLKNYLPNWTAPAYRPPLIKPEKTKLFWEKVGEIIEPFAKKIQMRFMAKSIKEKMNKNNDVIINDRFIKLHTIDRRDFYFEQYLNNLKKYE